MIAVGAQIPKRLPKPHPLKNPRQAATVPPTAKPSQVSGRAVATEPSLFQQSTRCRHHAQQEDHETLEVEVDPLPSQPAFPIAQVMATHSSEL